jgi:oxygen-dependent protoporphyrinogen oxidase
MPTRLGAFVRTRLFSWPGKARMAAEIFVPKRPSGGDESIGAFMRRRFGDEAVTYLAEPLLAGIHVGDVERLSVAALFPQLERAEQEHGSVLLAFRRRPAPPPSSGGGFKSLPGGLSELVRAVVGALPAGSIRLQTPTCRIDGRGPFTVISTDGRSIDAAALILATPAYVTAGLVRERDDELAGLCAEIGYASSATIVHAFERRAVRHPLNGSGFVVPRVEGIGILAGSWLSSKWPHRAPDDRVLMRSFVGGARDPGALECSDDELVSRSLGALGPLLGINGTPQFSRVYRWTRANAQYEVGHLARLAAIERALGRHPGLFVTGSGFRGVGIPDCVADGRATARRAAEYLASSTKGRT